MVETLGDRIRKARQAYGMSQAELARRVGVSKNSMNLIESNKTQILASCKVKAIADVLKVSVDSLLGREEEGGALGRRRGLGWRLAPRRQ